MIEGGVSALQDLSRYMPDIAKAATASRDSAKLGAGGSGHSRQTEHRP